MHITHHLNTSHPWDASTHLFSFVLFRLGYFHANKCFDRPLGASFRLGFNHYVSVFRLNFMNFWPLCLYCDITSALLIIYFFFGIHMVSSMDLLLARSSFGDHGYISSTPCEIRLLFDFSK